MLAEAKALRGLTIAGLDGEIGSVDEILFDDAHWTVRYLVVDTSRWLFGRKALISPMSFGKIDWKMLTLKINLTREQIKNSPDVATDEPVSRQWETDYFDYYSWPYYWDGTGNWGTYWYPGPMEDHSEGMYGLSMNRDYGMQQDQGDAHLRSTKEVTGYMIAASDGDIGHIHDFIFDDKTWRISYLAVDTRDWLPGKKVLVPPHWISSVKWLERCVSVNLTREQIKDSPAWNPNQPIDSGIESNLRDYYDKQLPNNRVPMPV